MFESLKEKRKQASQEDRKRAIFNALDSAISMLNSFNIPIIAALFQRFPSLPEAREFQSTGRKVAQSYKTLDRMLGTLRTQLGAVHKRLYTVEGFQAIFKTFEGLQQHINNDFRHALIELFQTGADAEPYHIRQISDTLRLKGESTVHSLISKLNEIQSLMQSMISSSQYADAKEMVLHKRAISENKVALQQAETESTKAEQQKQRAHSLNRQEELEKLRSLQNQKKQDALAIRDKQVELEKVQARREHSQFKRDSIKSLEELPTKMFLEALDGHLGRLLDREYQIENKAILKRLFESFELLIFNVGVVPVTRRHLIPDYSQRVEIQEAMLDMWDRLANRVDQDPTLTDEQKENRKMLYEDICQRDMDALYEQEEKQ